jgi:hypothetical protein
MIKKIKVLPSTSKSFSKTALGYCWLQAFGLRRRLRASKVFKAPSISTKLFEFTQSFEFNKVLRPKTTTTFLLLSWEVPFRFLPIELTPPQLPVQVNWTTSKTKLLLFREDSHWLLASELTLLQLSCLSRFDFDKTDFRLEDNYRDKVSVLLRRLPLIFAYRTDTCAVGLSKSVDFLSDESYLIHF